MAEVTFYADESGIHDPRGNQPGSEVAAIAGYVATKAQWLKLERRWNTALAKYGVPVFHMSEFNRKEKDQKPHSPYKGWSSTKKKKFLRTLIKIASKIPLAGYGSMVQTKAWDSILADDTKIAIPVPYGKKGNTVHNPYIECFTNFFAKFPQFLDKAVNPLLSEYSPVSKVTFVFDQHKHFGPAALADYDISRNLLKDDRFGSFALDDSKSAPLQAADLLAFFSRRRFTRYLSNKAPDEFELKLLEPDPLNPDKVYLIYLSNDNLKDFQQNSEKLRVERGTETSRA